MTFNTQNKFGIYYTSLPIKLKSGNLGFKLPKKLVFSKKETLGYKQTAKELTKIRKINSGNDFAVGLYHKGKLIKKGSSGIRQLLDDIEFKQEMKSFEKEYH